MYKRTLTQVILKSFKNGFVTVVYGARRVGKTVLLEQIRAAFHNEDILIFNGDTAESIQALSSTSEVQLSSLVKNHEVIFIDEAQRIPNISLALKIIIDKFPEKKIVVTGSSSLQLARGAQENLTGRNTTFALFPLSSVELLDGEPAFKAPAFLETQLVFGGYPLVHTLGGSEERKRYLAGIVEDYLLRDVLMLERLDHPEQLKKLAVLLAFQIGNEVSLNELANTLNLSVKTVARYLDLLEKSFIVFRLDAYSRNQRKEVGKSKKYYFYDLGIRNALVTQFQPLSERVDVGALWENFLIVERKKKHAYAQRMVTQHFWRNYAGAEIDIVEVADGVLSAFECKWGAGSARPPKAFVGAYPDAAFQVINRENYFGFVS